MDVEPVLAAVVAVAVGSALATVFMPPQCQDGNDEQVDTPQPLFLLILKRNSRLSECRLNFCRGN